MKPRRKKNNPTTIIALAQSHPGKARRLTRELLVAIQRQCQVRQYRQLRKHGVSTAKAALICRTSIPSIWRWDRQFRAEGQAGLTPKTARCGRKPKRR